MLVLSRKVGERILIGDGIAITVVRIGQGGVRIGIEAPKEMPVVREELNKDDSAVLVHKPNQQGTTTQDDSFNSSNEKNTEKSPRILPR